jgi:hypothetical protein
MMRKTIPRDAPRCLPSQVVTRLFPALWRTENTRDLAGAIPRVVEQFTTNPAVCWKKTKSKDLMSDKLQFVVAVDFGT